MTRKKKRAQRSRAAPERFKPPRINWQQLLADLNQHGCSGYRVASDLGVGWSTVQSWLRMKRDPRYSYGRSLILLHASYCGAGLTFQRLTEGGDAAYTANA